jgi:hypothetical protein
MGAQLTALCPFAVLTARLQPLGMSPFRKPRRIGVFPSWVRRRERRREGGEVGEVGEGEEERGRGGSARDAAGAPRPEAVRVHGEPYQSPRRRGAGTEQEVERRREHLHRAAFFAKSATTTSRTQRELNRSLALSCVASLPWSCL